MSVRSPGYVWNVQASTPEAKTQRASRLALIGPPGNKMTLEELLEYGRTKATGDYQRMFDRAFPTLRKRKRR